MEKSTYASLGSLGDSFHQQFDESANRIRQEFSQKYPIYIHGKPKYSREWILDFSPSNKRLLLGKFSSGSLGDVKEAVQSAKAAFSEWRALHWQDRITLLRKAAQLMTQQQYELAALMSFEVGKNRFEAIAEVSESVDLILYYCQQMEEHNGYEIPMSHSGGENTCSVLKPYGVWAVVSPFNFPLALATGICTGALVAGNTVVFKAASDTPWTGLRLYEIFNQAGLPKGVINFITGSGKVVGEEFIENSAVDGFVFTGSREIGMHILHHFSRKKLRPCIAEMGGKNAAIVMSSANLDDATEGVLRSAFGMGGQKCSACSRLYLHRRISKSFLDLLIEKTKKLKIGDPLARETFLGPLINAQAVRKFQRAVNLGRKEGHILHGGQILTKEEYAHGYFVEPTIVNRLSRTSLLFREEFFAPILVVAEVKNLEEAISLANQSVYGLTGGIFTQDPKEQKQFFDQIEVGVSYCNRRGGATTGAWPGIQSFGGWKDSGSSGKNALGMYYVAQFMREQSQTIAQKS